MFYLILSIQYAKTCSCLLTFIIYLIFWIYYMIYYNTFTHSPYRFTSSYLPTM